MNNLKIGDLIRCKDKEDMVNTMYDLQDAGIESDFVFEHDGESGNWLQIIKIGEE